MLARNTRGPTAQHDRAFFARACSGPLPCLCGTPWIWPQSRPAGLHASDDGVVSIPASTCGIRPRPGREVRDRRLADAIGEATYLFHMGCHTGPNTVQQHGRRISGLSITFGCYGDRPTESSRSPYDGPYCCNVAGCVPCAICGHIFVLHATRLRSNRNRCLSVWRTHRVPQIASMHSSPYDAVYAKDPEMARTISGTLYGRPYCTSWMRAVRPHIWHGIAHYRLERPRHKQ